MKYLDGSVQDFSSDSTIELTSVFPNSLELNTNASPKTGTVAVGATSEIGSLIKVVKKGCNNNGIRTGYITGFIDMPKPTSVVLSSTGCSGSKFTASNDKASDAPFNIRTYCDITVRLNFEGLLLIEKFLLF